MKKKTNKQKSLDLHGFKEDEVFDAVEKFLNKSKGQSQVQIIHGRGKGIVKNKVIEYLKLANFPYTAENEGSLIVYLD